MGTKSKKHQQGASGGLQQFYQVHIFNEQTKASEYTTIKMKDRNDYVVLLHQKKIRG